MEASDWILNFYHIKNDNYCVYNFLKEMEIVINM